MQVEQQAQRVFNNKPKWAICETEIAVNHVPLRSETNVIKFILL